MSRLRRIVIGYTFAPDGEFALRSALALAERAHAALYLLHVVEPYPVYIKMRFPSVPAEALLEEVVLKTRAQLQDLAERVQPPMSTLRLTPALVSPLSN
jgi:nucleotide-binding universal stress UspA family protein